MQAAIKGAGERIRHEALSDGVGDVVNRVEHGSEESALDGVDHIVAVNGVVDEPAEQVAVPQASCRRVICRVNTGHRPYAPGSLRTRGSST